MSPQLLTDLYQATNWHGFRPGMTRAEVLERVQELGQTAEWEGEDLMRILVEDDEVGFYFASDGADRLLQLSTDNEELTWNGKPFMGARIDEALRALDSSHTPLWQIGSGIQQFSQAPQDTPSLSDEELIEGGTLWLPEHGLALHISEGQLFEIAWRAPHDLPKQYLGPLTDAQRQLSARPDLEDYLLEKRKERNRAGEPKAAPPILDTLRTLLTVGAVACVGFTGWIGFQDMKVWKAAPVLSGKLLAVETGPSKQFFEYLPPAISRLIPARTGHLFGVPPQTDIYRVEFVDPDGERREARLESAEFYVPPREIGEEVQVTYVGGQMPRVKGPARARDAAFIDHVPWVIALGVVYLAGQLFISLLPALIRLVARLGKQIARPQSSLRDSDRPELL